MLVKDIFRQALLFILIGVFTASAALADGKFFSALDKVKQPEQRALLWLDGGQETILIQTKYEGAAGDFGWVVPVPSKPTVSTGEAAIFDELARITRPDVVPPWWMYTTFPIILLGGSKASMEATGVTVLDSIQAGPYDVQILAATDAGALKDWLDDKGYEMPAGSEKVLKSYVDRGWYYAAVKVNPEHTKAELIENLKALTPGSSHLLSAEELTTLIFKLEDNTPDEGRVILEKLTTLTDKALGSAARYWTPSLGKPRGKEGVFLLNIFDRYYERRDDSSKSLEDRYALQDDIVSTIEASLKMAENALKDGNIAPLKLEFSSNELIYPLYMTSLAGREVEVELYVLSDHKMKAKQFDIIHAERLKQVNFIGTYPQLDAAIKPSRDYLTKLRAKLSPAQMSDDLVINRALTNWGKREHLVTDMGLSWWEHIIVVIYHLFLAAIIFLIGRKIVRKRRQSKPRNPHVIMDE